MPDHWQESTLGEVGEVNPKEAPLAEDAPFVPMDAVNVGQRWVEYTEPRGTRSGARARAGDVLFARITPCLENGKTAQVQHEIDRCGGSTEFIVLRGTERLDADFLYFWATDRNVRERAANLMTGSTGRQRLSPKDLAAMTLSVPPISEQRRIVDLVGSIDTYIDSLETQIETTRTARSALLSELLSDPGDDWQETTLGNIARIEATMVDPTKPEFADLPHIGIEAIKSREGRLGSFNSVRGDGVTSGKFLFSEHDIIYSKIRPELRKVAYPQFVGLCSADAYPLRPASNCSASFLLVLLLSEIFVEQAIAKSGRTKMPKINRRELFEITFSLPPADEQQRIVDLVGSFDEQVSSLESQIESVRTLRSGVLSELLSGERLLDESYDVAVGL